MNPNTTTTYRNSKFCRELRDAIMQHYNLAELKILAHDLSIDWEAIPGESKILKVLELIGHFNRRNALQDLTQQLRKDREMVDWPGLPGGSFVHIDFEYKATGITREGKPIVNSGKASLKNEIKGDYYDEGLAFAEAVSTIADHVYIFEVEKKGDWGISELHVSIFNLESSINLPSPETE